MQKQNHHEKNSKRSLVFVLCTVIALVTFVLGLSAVSDQQASGARGEEMENLVSSDGVVRTQENCALEQTYRFVPCGHTVTRRIQLPDSLQGADFEQVQHYYHQWQVDAFSPYSVALSRDEEIYCPMHYVLMTDETGRLGIFQNVYGDGLALVQQLDAMIGNFNEEMREKLYAGIGFDSAEDAEAWLRENGKS